MSNLIQLYSSCVGVYYARFVPDLAITYIYVQSSIYIYVRSLSFMSWSCLNLRYNKVTIRNDTFYIPQIGNFLTKLT